MNDWAPSCSPQQLRLRAKVLATIRRFFDDRGVLEVETPLLCRAGVTDPNLAPFITPYFLPGQPDGLPLYLQTSPEFAMKRLLAAGSSSIFQICKAFRNEERGRFHNPEFTLLEWYRLDFGLPELTDEVDALLSQIFRDTRPLAGSERLAYRDVFRDITGLDPQTAGLSDFARCCRRHGLAEAQLLCGDDRATWLDLVFSHLVQPTLGKGRLSFVYDFPSTLPSLARRKPGDPDVVERVEVYLAGVELANGFHELADPMEQDQRFDADLAKRRELGLPQPPKDRRLLAALASGLPDCSGVALGLDRLLMLLAGADSIDEVIAFPIDSA